MTPQADIISYNLIKNKLIILMSKQSKEQGRKKITSLFGSERRYTRSGSITTTIDKQSDIKKSRIINLPNYKRQTMECRLDFVIVFQTIQIQRLSLEIQSLRIRLLDSQRQIFNYKNYEVQIRELTERCFDFQKQRYKLQEQIKYLKANNKQIQEQYQNIREKAYEYQDKLQEKQNQTFKYKEQLIIQRKQREQMEDIKSKLQLTIKDKEKTFNKHLKQFQKSTLVKKTQINKNQEALNNLLQKYQEQIKELRKQNTKMSALYDKLLYNAKQQQQKYNELQEQLYKLQESLKQKQFQLQNNEDEHKERIEHLQNKYQQECTNKIKEVENYQIENYELKNQMEKMENTLSEYQAKILQFQQQNQKYEMLLNQAGHEIDRLNTIIKDKIKYLDAWQDRYNQLQNKYQDFAQQNHQMQQTNKRNQDQLHQINYNLKIKTQQLEKSEKMRQNDLKQVSQKLKEGQINKNQMVHLKRQIQQQRQDNKRQQVENHQIKEQLNRRIQESTKLFQEINKLQQELKEFKMHFSHAQNTIKKKNDDLNQAKNHITTLTSKIQKYILQRRELQQQIIKIKGLEQLLKHEQQKKNEYLNEGKKLMFKYKQLQKSHLERSNIIKQLHIDIQNYKTYINQLENRIGYLEGELELMHSLEKELEDFGEVNKNQEENILIMKQEIQQKTNDLMSLKNRLLEYEKYMKQFILHQKKFQEQLQNNFNILENLKLLRQQHQALQNQYEQLQTKIFIVNNQKQCGLKQIKNLQKIIKINQKQLARIQEQSKENHNQMMSRKQNQRQLINKLKQAEKKFKTSQSQFQKEKTKINKQKAQFQKVLDKKIRKIENDLKNEKIQKEKLIQNKQKIVKQKQISIATLNQENDELKDLIKKNDLQKDKIYRHSKQLQKSLADVQHELKRIQAQYSQVNKELNITVSNHDQKVNRIKDYQHELQSFSLRLKKQIKNKEELSAQIQNYKGIVYDKQQDISHLMDQCKQFKEEMKIMMLQIKRYQENNSCLEEEIIKLKFQAENVCLEFVKVNKRLFTLDNIIKELKNMISKIIKSHHTFDQQRTQIQKKNLLLYSELLAEMQRFEGMNYKQNQQIIRLQTVNKILQIQIGQIKERQSFLFSIVKESSTIKQRQEKEVVQRKDISRHAQRKGKEKEREREREREISPKMIKEAQFGQINIISKKSRSGTTKIEEQIESLGDISHSEYGIMKSSKLFKDNPLKNTKNRVYFDNLIHKNT